MPVGPSLLSGLSLAVPYQHQHHQCVWGLVLPKGAPALPCQGPSPCVLGRVHRCSCVGRGACSLALVCIVEQCERKCRLGVRKNSSTLRVAKPRRCCPGSLWHLFPRRHSDQTRGSVLINLLWLTLLPAGGLDLAIQRCLPTSTILSFWASVIGHSLVMMLKMPLDILSVEKISSFVSCVARLFLLHQHACAEIFLLAVVAYDRSVAMCQPRGSTVSRQKVCAVAVARLRAGATLPLSAPVALTFVCPAAAPMSLTASSERCWPVLLRAAGRVRSLSPQVAPIPWCATWPCWAPVG